MIRVRRQYAAAFLIVLGLDMLPGVAGALGKLCAGIILALGILLLI